MKERCVIYYGQILKKEMDGLQVLGVPDLFLVMIFLLNLIILMTCKQYAVPINKFYKVTICLTKKMYVQYFQHLIIAIDAVMKLV